jgi:hypothetical protein
LWQIAQVAVDLWQSRQSPSRFNESGLELTMPHPTQGLVDILEIYHARQLRDDLLTNLRRMRQDNPLDPFQDPLRREETRSYYEAMLLTICELLHGLGDEAPLN